MYNFDYHAAWSLGMLAWQCLYNVEENIMGLTIRKALPEDAYKYTICHISIWQSAYKGIVPEEYLKNMYIIAPYKQNL